MLADAAHRPQRRHPKRLVARTDVIGSLQVPAARYRRSIGVAPKEPCVASSAGQRRQVKYEADYVFYK